MYFIHLVSKLGIRRKYLKIQTMLLFYARRSLEFFFRFLASRYCFTAVAHEFIYIFIVLKIRIHFKRFAH